MGHIYCPARIRHVAGTDKLAEFPLRFNRKAVLRTGGMTPTNNLLRFLINLLRAQRK